jgi:hypothetical protein
MTYISGVDNAIRAFKKNKNYARLHEIRNHYKTHVANIALNRNRYESAHNWYLKLNEAALRLVEIETAYIALVEQYTEDSKDK